MAGFPDEWQIPSRNRQYSNQPGSFAKPEQVMATDFSPDSPESNHMRATADALRQEPDIEVDMDYEISNQPEVEPYDAA